ncbi:MCE family protein [Rhodococcus sp. X156]|uniref:MCE family protein n=1 Tax=Rhodococcus sp. X156 TaxID=2499145 RepID=UPI000FD74413|nr:MCE family protein [Rhodococcus sp. X156]
MKSLVPPLLKLGAFILITLLATGLLAATISNSGSGGGPAVKAVFTDVTGLNVGDDVRISGVKVGRVSKIKIKDKRLAEVNMDLEKNRTIPADATATLRYRNIVGQRYIAVGQGDSASSGSMADGGVIPVEQTEPAVDLTVLFGGFKPLFQALEPAQVNQLSYEIIQVLQGEGGTVNSLVANTATLTNSIADKDRVIGELIGNLNTVLDTVNQRSDKVSSLVVSLQQLVSGLSQDREAITSSISSLSQLADATTALLRPARSPLQSSIAALGDVSANLNRNEARVNTFLVNLPTKLDGVNRTASYGSWFNQYLCSADISFGLGGSVPPLALPTGIASTQLPIYTNTAPRCYKQGQ